MDPDRDDLLDYILARLREGPRLAQDHIQKDGKLLRHRSAFLKFKMYINKFLDSNTENRYIVMPGLRGVGKTTLLFQLHNYLMVDKNIGRDRILYISTDHLSEYLGGRIIDAIDVFVSEVHQQTPATLDKELFIFIDEAQHDKGWSKAGKIFYDQSKNIFMIFTGSSALNLEINTDAVRRIKKEAVFPMNFSEYLILKHDGIFYPPRGTAGSLRDLIFNGELDNAYNKENQIMRRSVKLPGPIDKEWENYLYSGGFPFGIDLDDIDFHERSFSMLNRVIEKDVSLLRSFRVESRSTISRILMFLALQKPGETSETRLAKNLGVSSALVKDMLTILEKTHLIFSVKPYSRSASKIVRKAWKYYFLSPSIKASINFILGKQIQNNREFLGLLAENLVASHFFRTKETVNNPHGLFYDPEKRGVDFLLTKITGEIIPVEVGVGKKSSSQIERAIDNFDSDYGILVSNATNRITQIEDVIHVPLITFSFL